MSRLERLEVEQREAVLLLELTRGTPLGASVHADIEERAKIILALQTARNAEGVRTEEKENESD